MKTKTNLRNASVMDKLTLGQEVLLGMTGKPVFAPLAPLIAQMQTLTDNLAQANQDAQIARQTARQTIAAQQEVEANWDRAIGVLAAAVEQVSAGDSTVIISSGFKVRDETLPIGALGAPGNLQAITNGHQGQIKLRWGKVRGGKSYEVQLCTSPSLNDWTAATSVTRADAVLSELPSATRCAFRVRALGTAGPSGWSNPVITTVP